MRSKWVMSQVGRNVAKLNSSSVAKIAVANKEQDIMVQGSMTMERFRTSPRGAVLALLTSESGRSSMNGTVVLITLAKVVKISVEGCIRKKDDRSITCGVDRRRDAAATSYAEKCQYSARLIYFPPHHHNARTSRCRVLRLSKPKDQRPPPTIQNASILPQDRPGSTPQ